MKAKSCKNEIVQKYLSCVKKLEEAEEHLESTTMEMEYTEDEQVKAMTNDIIDMMKKSIQIQKNQMETYLGKMTKAQLKKVNK